MGNELVEQNEQALVVNKSKSADDILAERAVILDVMKRCMKKGHDYGIIPGCKLPSLFKPGAEKILSAFRIAVSDPIVDDISTEDERRYRVTIRAISHSGIFLGAAVGECSSSEDKYKWKKAVCNEEWEETPENMRREKWKNGKNGSYKAKQIRTCIADVSNTVLSMACKRPTVAVTRMITSASDLFTQDIETLEDLINIGGDPDNNGNDVPKSTKPQTEAPKAKTEDKPGPTDNSNTIPSISGMVVKIEPHNYRSGKVKTDYTITNDEGEKLVISIWKKPDTSIELDSFVMALDITTSVYNGVTQYTAKNIGINETEPDVEFPDKK